MRKERQSEKDHRGCEVRRPGGKLRSDCRVGGTDPSCRHLLEGRARRPRQAIRLVEFGRTESGQGYNHRPMPVRNSGRSPFVDSVSGHGCTGCVDRSHNGGSSSGILDDLRDRIWHGRVCNRF